jgi:replicative DNA helicase Mcm
MPSYDLQKDALKSSLVNFFSDPDNGKKLDGALSEFATKKSEIIIINLDELDQSLVEEIVENASKYGIAAVGEFVEESLRHQYSGIVIDSSHISISASNFVPKINIHDIGSKQIGKMVQVHGLVNKTSIIHPMYVSAVFKCSECGEETARITQESPWMLTKPLGKCQGCDAKIPVWEPVPESSELLDSQEFTLQESYEDISSNRMPRPILCITFKRHLLNFVNCGDDIDAVCIVKAMTAMRKSSKSKFNITYLEVLSINKKRKDPESIVFTPEEEQQFVELSKDPQLYKKMIDSVAPSLYGHNDEKEAVMLAIFGSPEEKREDIVIRGNIHILMVGDPATAKSQLLRAAVALSPRGMYAMGRGTTAAGLTAALHKSENNDEWEISAGVLVLADEGIAAIDEIEKMREEDRVNIHEAMEQQTVSIDKAGVHVQLRARTALIAAANPTLGRYDSYKSVFENLPKFPPSLFSRFDLIFKVLDVPNEEMDLKVVSHIIDCKEQKSPIDRALLRKYIAFSKRTKPTLSHEASESLKMYFVAVRKNFTSDQKTFPFSYRQFEALKRLTLARARALLKTEADKYDVEVVKRLFDVFLKDTVGGDVTSIETGMDVTQRNLAQIILEMLKKHPMTKDDLRNAVNCGDDVKFEKALTRLISDSVIYEQSRSLDGKPVYASTY